MRILFVGGFGTISTSTITACVNDGAEIAVLNRSRRGYELASRSPSFSPVSQAITVFTGDRNDAGTLASCVEAFRPDVVADFVCYTPERAREIAQICIEHHVRHYIFVSTVNVSGYPLSRLPFRELDRPTELRGTYAQDKAASEEYLLGEHRAGRLPLTISRPAMSFGPSALVSFLAGDGMKYQVPRMRAGRPALIPGDGTTLMPLSCADNTGRMIACLILEPEKSEGRIFHCAHPSCIDYNEYLHLVAVAAGGTVNPVYIPLETIREALPPSEDNRILTGITPFNRVYSVEAFASAFPDFEWGKTLEDGIREYVERHDSEGLFPALENEIIEDRLIASWIEHRDAFVKEMRE